MADLTTEQLAYLRTQLGTTIDTTDLQDRYDRLDDEVLVAREVLQQRLADLLAAPASFSVAGEYSQSTADNIKALREQLSSMPSSSAGGPAVVRVLDAQARWAR